MMMMQKIGTAAATPMTNCLVSKQPSAPYAVVDCRFTNIVSGNNDVLVDTSYAKVNFYFNEGETGEYMGGGGSTSFRRVHCTRTASLLSSPDTCNKPADLVDWTEYQAKCDPAVTNRDPNCTARDPNYDGSEMWNVFSTGTGSLVMKGGSGVAGANFYAPFASIALIGGGNPNDIDFMGRVWANNIELRGNVALRVPNTLNPAWCTTSCPGGNQAPIYDVVARSFAYAAAF
jgi:hypothetical protein